MRALIKAFARFHALVYRLSRGRLLARLSGNDMLLLTTTGRKSGKPRTLPLLFVKDGDRYVVVASFGGAPRHPAWYLNLVSNPAVAVQVRSRKILARAETAGPEDRARLWPQVVAAYAAYDEYQKRTTREIPLVLLMED
ncbi:MAG: nitroreductase family deazaflavin-dependent oxidoreductase [Dehalococcoidia bacterium]